MKTALEQLKAGVPIEEIFERWQGSFTPAQLMAELLMNSSIFRKHFDRHKGVINYTADLSYLFDVDERVISGDRRGVEHEKLCETYDLTMEELNKILSANIEVPPTTEYVEEPILVVTDPNKAIISTLLFTLFNTLMIIGLYAIIILSEVN